MAKKNKHVLPHNDNCAVKGAGHENVTKTFDKKTDAIDYAKEIAKNQQS
jgi:hypothetical protein